MDYLRLAKVGIENREELDNLPCDMGFVGKDGGDHPFLYAQAAGRTDEGDVRIPVGGLATETPYETGTSFEEYENEPNGGYKPHGSGFPGEEEEWEWEDPDLKDPDEEEDEPEPEPEESDGGEDSDSDSGSSDPIADIMAHTYDRIPIIDAAIKARAVIIAEHAKNGTEVTEDLECWTHKANCQRLGFWKDVPLLKEGLSYDVEELKGNRWGWFHPIRSDEPPYPENTRLVGRPLIGSYNKTWILPPPEEGWSEEWEKGFDEWWAEHDEGPYPEPAPWDGHEEDGKWIPGDKTLRQRYEFGRCIVDQQAFTGAFSLEVYDVEDSDSDSDSSDSDSSDSSDSDSENAPQDEGTGWDLPEGEDESDSDEKKKTRKKVLYIGTTKVPNPGFENPCRAAERWAMAPLLEELRGPDPMSTKVFKLPDRFEMHDLLHEDGLIEVIYAEDPDENDEDEDNGDEPQELGEDEEEDEDTHGVSVPDLEFHTLRKGEYDWRFFCGFGERRKHDRVNNGDGDVMHTIHVTYHPIWWSVKKPQIDTPTTPLSDSGLMAQISWWAHCVQGIPWGSRIDVRVVAHVHAMKIASAVASKLRSWGWVRTPVNTGGKQPKAGREWWHTYTKYEIRIRQHLPLK